MDRLRNLWQTIREFGLEYCDLPTMMGNVASLLRALTVNIDSKHNKGIPFPAYILTTVTAFCYFYVYLFSMTWFVFYRCRINGELVAAVVVLSLGINSEIGSLKLLYMGFFIDKIKKLTDNYLKCDSQIVKGSRFDSNLLKTLRVVKKRHHLLDDLIHAFDMDSFRNLWQSIREFGLDYCDLPIMMGNVASLLRALTVNIDSKHNKGIPFPAYILTGVTSFCYFYVYLFSMTWFVFYRCRITGELVAAMVVLSLGISSEIGTLKLLYMGFFIDKIKKLADNYLECDSQVVKGSRFDSNLLKTLRVVKKRAIIYWMVLVGNGVIYLLTPVLQPGKNLPENYFVIYGLEPMFETPNFQIAFFMMTAGVFFICYVPATVTAYLIVITGYTEAQMIALAQEMLHIWSDAIKQTEAQMNQTVSETSFSNHNAETSRVINKFVDKRLKEIIIRHGIVINLLGQVEGVFRGAIAMGFVLLILGLIAELLGKLENTYLQMPFAFMQVAMDCFVGQRLMDACNMFEEAVYDCKWENFDKANMKLVLVMLQSSQKTMTLSAGGFSTLSFMSLMSVTRGIYSAYTALRSTLN